jgi:hypothetical protein
MPAPAACQTLVMLALYDTALLMNWYYQRVTMQHALGLPWSPSPGPVTVSLS